MSKEQTAEKLVWEEMNNKCDEIITRIVEKKKRQSKSKKKDVVVPQKLNN